MDENNILKGVEKLSYSQEFIKRNFKTLLLVTAGLIAFIFFIAFPISWIEIEKPESQIPPFTSAPYQEGSVKYQNSDHIVLSGEFFDEQIATLIRNQNTYNLNSIVLSLNSLLRQKTVIVPQISTFAKIKTSEAIDLIHQRNQIIIDSLNNVMRKRVFLDYLASSLLEKTNISETYLNNLNNELNQLELRFEGDFPSSISDFSYQIGKFNSLRFESTGKLVIKCTESAPVLSGPFLTKAGVPESRINTSDLQKQTASLQKIISGAEFSHKQRIAKELKDIRMQTSRIRADYRKNFYIKWYSTLLLLINSSIFFMLLMRFFMIVRQKTIPRKSTDLIYYATNRTSRIFRIIALLLIVIALIYLVINLIMAIFNQHEGFFDLPFIDSDDLFVYALYSPAFVFIITVVGTWFFILTSEWIDFISNCYEVVFYKAHQRKVGEEDKTNN